MAMLEEFVMAMCLFSLSRRNRATRTGSSTMSMLTKSNNGMPFNSSNSLKASIISTSILLEWFRILVLLSLEGWLAVLGVIKIVLFGN